MSLLIGGVGAWLGREIHNVTYVSQLRKINELFRLPIFGTATQARRVSDVSTLTGCSYMYTHVHTCTLYM